MKLQLEFEESDLREMIQGYFRSNGFRVKNLDQLCQLFQKAFPDGIKVQAETAADGVTSEIPEVATERAAVALVTPPPNGRDTSKGANVAMSATDLFDPTPGKVPTRDEQLRQSQREVANIVAQSKAIAAKRTKDEA